MTDGLRETFSSSINFTTGFFIIFRFYLFAVITSIPLLLLSALKDLVKRIQNDSRRIAAIAIRENIKLWDRF